MTLPPPPSPALLLRRSLSRYPPPHSLGDRGAEAVLRKRGAAADIDRGKVKKRWVKDEKGQWHSTSERTAPAASKSSPGAGKSQARQILDRLPIGTRVKISAAPASSIAAAAGAALPASVSGWVAGVNSETGQVYVKSDAGTTVVMASPGTLAQLLDEGSLTVAGAPVEQLLQTGQGTQEKAPVLRINQPPGKLSRHVPPMHPSSTLKKPVLQLDAATNQIVGRFDSLTQAAGRVQTQGRGFSGMGEGGGKRRRRREMLTI
jgi:hypothetical protein